MLSFIVKRWLTVTNAQPLQSRVTAIHFVHLYFEAKSMVRPENGKPVGETLPLTDSVLKNIALDGYMQKIASNSRQV